MSDKFQQGFYIVQIAKEQRDIDMYGHRVWRDCTANELAYFDDDIELSVDNDTLCSAPIFVAEGDYALYDPYSHTAYIYDYAHELEDVFRSIIDLDEICYEDDESVHTWREVLDKQPTDFDLVSLIQDCARMVICSADRLWGAPMNNPTAGIKSARRWNL